MSKNTELQQRRVDAVARGVGNATQLFAVKALNAEIWDADGRRYIDFAGGIGVMNTGHRHPKVMARIQQQLEAVVHSCFQVMPYEPYIELAEQLNKRAPIDGKAEWPCSSPPVRKRSRMPSRSPEPIPNAPA